MASRGLGSRGRPRGYGPPSPVFDPQAFMETMGATVTTIVQAGVARGQGGMSSLHSMVSNLVFNLDLGNFFYYCHKTN